MTDKEKSGVIRGEYMTMSYSIEPDGTRFPLNYKLYIERLEVALYNAEDAMQQLGWQLDDCQKKIDNIVNSDSPEMKEWIKDRVKQL